ncbi:Scd6-like Sm domain-containing protein [Cerioporus squamosus]|nr:Scd6-like Sm domain-containing protein [Cerioporus squamosus]
MAALSFIGKPISLVSHSDVRYRGILAGIDPVASTIQLSNVYSMGTESRRPPNEYIPPVQEPYTYIIFRASEVKDLAVDEPAAQQRRNVHDDPAVLGASPQPQIAPTYPPFGSLSYQQQTAAGVPPQQGQGQVPPRQQQAFANRQQAAQPSGSQQPGQVPNAQSPPNGAAAAPPRNGRNTAVNSATASMETVERALGDLRVSGANGASQQQRGGRRGGRGQGQEIKAGDLRIPNVPFDFDASNSRFDKAALAPSPRGTPKNDDEGEEGEVDEEEKKDDGTTTAYNPKKSFFDSLSSGSNGPSADGRGRGGRRGGGRNRREEERERNVATFGEPGGVGLMGPGAYVGGWGGYGRRGGGRGRRGGAHVGARS